MSKFYWIFILIVSSSGLLMSQSSILRLEEFIKEVKNFHPIIQRSDLINKSASVNALSAKAKFDPNVYFENDFKSIDGKNYYSYQNYGLNINTRSPVTIKAGHDNASGEFTNPEYTIGGITYFGISVPLLNGFAMDERRAALQQAKLITKQSALASQVMINNLLLDAHLAYYRWATSYLSYNLLNEFAAAALERLKLTRISQLNGDRSAADTVEAAMQFQYFQIQLQELKMEFVNETIGLSSFLWTSNGQGYLLDDTYIPDTMLFQKKEFLNGEIAAPDPIIRNPEIIQYDLKLASLEVERKLKKQYLLPKLDLKVSALSRNSNLFGVLDGYQLEDNFKTGIDFSYPIFTRHAKAELEANKIKTENLQLDQKEKIREYTLKLQRFQSEYSVLSRQLSEVNKVVQNASTLLEYENFKFRQGESTIFLINNRETKAIEARLKELAFLEKMLITTSKIKWISGEWINE